MILLLMIHRIDLKFKLHEFHNFWTFRSNILYISDLFIYHLRESIVANYRHI